MAKFTHVWVLAVFFVGCNVDYDTAVVKLAGDSDVSTNNGTDADSTNVGMSAVGDVGVADQAMCVAQSDEELCGQANALCDRITRTDDCGTPRNPFCGSCGEGANCERNTCEEDNCRNGDDDDGDDLRDCDDPDCDGRRCGFGNRYCQDFKCESR